MFRKLYFDIEVPKTVKYLREKGYSLPQAKRILLDVENTYLERDSVLDDRKEPLLIVKDYEFMFGLPMIQ